jgi:hypothetical protein
MSLHFCNDCDRAMSLDVTTGRVIFKCACGAETPGGPFDARVGGAALGISETTEMYRKLIETAPFDRTNQQVMRQCGCGRDYMTQIRIGDAEIIKFKCKCGHEEGGDVVAQTRGDSAPQRGSARKTSTAPATAPATTPGNKP